MRTCCSKVSIRISCIILVKVAVFLRGVKDILGFKKRSSWFCLIERLSLVYFRRVHIWDNFFNHHLLRWTNLATLTNLVSFLWNPLHHQSGIVLAEEVIVEWLLCKKGAYKIFESDQGIFIFIKHLNLLQLAKHAKNLP